MKDQVYLAVIRDLILNTNVVLGVYSVEFINNLYNKDYNTCRMFNNSLYDASQNFNNPMLHSTFTSLKYYPSKDSSIIDGSLVETSTNSYQLEMYHTSKFIIDFKLVPLTKM